MTECLSLARKFVASRSSIRFRTLLNDWPCKLIAYVLMPDHLHLIVNPKDGRIREFTGVLKSLSAKAIVRAVQGITIKKERGHARLPDLEPNWRTSGFILESLTIPKTVNKTSGASFYSLETIFRRPPCRQSEP